MTPQMHFNVGKTVAFIVTCIFMVSCEQARVKENQEAAIRQVLNDQVAAWNKGDIDQFMEGYWKSDSLHFIGSDIASGWNGTLLRYKKSYPDKEAMGTLRFEILEFNRISHDAYLITGKYFLQRINDSPHGIFTLLFRKKNGSWVIVNDHTGG